jgi:ELWxxDGT repeat protein
VTTLYSTLGISKIFNTNDFHNHATSGKVFVSAVINSELLVFATDGTVGGTVQVADLGNTSCCADGSPRPIVEMNGISYFIGGVDDDQHLWRSDGTPGGTYMVVPVTLTSSRRELIVYNNRIYFGGNDNTGIGEQLWSSGR